MAKVIKFVPIDMGVIVPNKTWEQVKESMPNAFVRKKDAKSVAIMCYPLFEKEVTIQILTYFKFD